MQTIDLGTLGGTSSYAYGVNESGWIVGEANTDGGARHATVWIDGQVFDLNPDGWRQSQAWGINDTGQIVGYGLDADGNQRAFFAELENPQGGVPEPSSLALLPMALTGLVMWRRRREV